ncbi:MAG: dephospho-CoA kinase [Leptolyngbyaceae cyanobacterium]
MGQRIIGLTGGIATGKSTVARYLAEQHQLPVLDADVYARQAVALGSPILAAIAEHFGPDILQADGSLNRAQLGCIVFNNRAEKEWLEQQIHPLVRQRFAEAMATLHETAAVVQVIPLLFEAKLTEQVTEIWVVTCSPATQLQRLIQRNQLSQSEAQQRMRNQWPLEQKAALADVVLDNETTLAHLYAQVDQTLGQ